MCEDQLKLRLFDNMSAILFRQHNQFHCNISNVLVHIPVVIQHD